MHVSSYHNAGRQHSSTSTFDARHWNGIHKISGKKAGISKQGINAHRRETILFRGIMIPAWISDNTYYKAGDEVAYPFLNVNGAAVDVGELISNSMPLTGVLLPAEVKSG